MLMGLSEPNRRTTDRISKRKLASEEVKSADSKTSSKRSPSTQPLPKEPSALTPSKKISVTAPKTEKTAAGTSGQNATRKPSEKLPVSTISKRQPVIPAAEVKKVSDKSAIPEPKKTSSKIPIAPLTPTAATTSSRRASSMETTIAKAAIITPSSRRATPMAGGAVEPVKTSTKRSKAGGSSQKSGRTSGKSSPRKGPSQNNLNVIYYVLGAILVILLILIGSSLANKGGDPKTRVVLNQLDKGLAICSQSAKTYGKDSEKAPEALRLLEEGIALVESELNKKRDANSNLPTNLRGYDVRLSEYYGFRKTLREGTLIINARKERNK